MQDQQFLMDENLDDPSYEEEAGNLCRHSPCGYPHNSGYKAQLMECPLLLAADCLLTVSLVRFFLVQCPVAKMMHH